MKNRGLIYWIAVLFLVLLVNTGYIAAFASATIFYMANVLGHVVLGAILTIALLFVLRRSGLLRGAPAAIGFLLLVALRLGAILTYAGNVHDNAWILWSHIGAAALGVAALIPFVWKKASQEGGGWLRFRKGFEVSLVILIALPIIGHGYKRFFPNPNNRIVNPAQSSSHNGRRRRRSEIAVLPRFRANERGRHHSVELFHGFGNLRTVPQEDLRRMERVVPSFRLVQQPVLPEGHRIHAGHAGLAAGQQVVRRLP